MYPTSNAEDGEKDINLSKLFCECSLVQVADFAYGNTEIRKLNFSFIFFCYGQSKL